MDEAEAGGLLDGQIAAFDHELERLSAAEDAAEALGAAGAGEDTERDFGHAHEVGLLAALLADAQVAGEGDLEPAADGVAVERGDHQLGGVLEAEEGLVRVEAEGVLLLGLQRLEVVDVRAGAEEAVARAADDDDVDPGVHPQVEHVGVELTVHRVAVAVGGGVVEGEDRDTVDVLAVNEHAYSKDSKRVATPWPTPTQSVATP